MSLTSLLAPLCVLCATAPDAPPHTVPAIASVQVSKTNLVGGSSLLVAVTLTAQATLGGSSVNITYSNASVFSSAPKGITIPSGQSSANFTLTTIPTATNVTVTVTGSLGSSSASANVTVRAPQVQTATFPSSVQGGTMTELSVTLDGPATITMSAAAPNDATIQLSSSSATAAPLASSVTVVQGAPAATVSFVPRVPLSSVSS